VSVCVCVQCLAVCF